MNSNTQEIEQQIIDDFALFDDPMERYEHLIDYGRDLAPLPDTYKRDEFLVKGCQSKVWLHAYTEGGKVYFEADSNTAITKGIIALLVKVLSGLPANEAAEHPLRFIDAVDLRSHLSSQRSNGLNSMIQKMKRYAQSVQS